ncbi:MAG: protein kinase [Akkermansiaceae bacterium]|nr:protein kinase [Akkermansiaceae bacterium]
MQVLGHISQRIAELHKEGYAHRDLKPGNIMWQPRTYTWVLIDFGLTAKIGEKARLGCTPIYAAPETACAVQAAQKSVVADAAVDAWALGVMAFELLVERSAFGMFASKAQVCTSSHMLSHARACLRVAPHLCSPTTCSSSPRYEHTCPAAPMSGCTAGQHCGLVDAVPTPNFRALFRCTQC